MLTRRFAAVAITVATLLAAAWPAAAGVGISNGQTGSRGQGGGVEDWTGTSTVCNGAGEGVWSATGEVIYRTRYPGCDGFSRDPAYVGVAPVGWEVWRFYGNDAAGQRGQAWTVSRVNLPEWGYDDPSRQYVFFTAHPSDAGAGYGTPWAVGDYTNPQGERVVQSGLVQSDGRRRLTTTDPFRSNGSCVSLQGSHPDLQDAFNPGSDRYDDLAGLREGVYSAFRAHAENYDSALIGMRIVDVNGSRSAGRDRAPASADDVDFGDPYPCSSAVDFVRSDQQTPVSLATCWIPLEARYKPFTRGGETRKGFTTAGGVRYNTRWNAASYDNAGPAERELRNIIFNEVASRQAQPGDTYDDLRPAQPYSLGAIGTKADIPPRDPGQAAAAARDHARCTFSDAMVLASQQSQQRRTNSGGDLTLQLDWPRNYLHVGGEIDEASFTTTVGPLTCGGSACRSSGGVPAPRLVGVDYTHRFSGTNGYSECASVFSVRCEWREDGRTRISRTNRVRADAESGGYRSFTFTSRESADLHLYRSTRPNQFLVAEIVGATATRQNFYMDSQSFCVDTSFEVEGEVEQRTECTTSYFVNWYFTTFAPSFAGPGNDFNDGREEYRVTGGVNR